MAPNGLSCGFAGCTMSGWRSARFNGSFAMSGCSRLRRTRKRAPRQMKLFEKAEPGESVQVDVKFVKIAGRWAFQYTALDDCTRFRSAPALSPSAPELEPGVPGGALPGVPLPDPQAPMRQRPRVPLRLCAGGPGARDPASLHQAPTPPTERQGRTESPDRPRGILGAPPIRRFRGGRGRAYGPGKRVTTMSASRWRFRVGRQQRSSQPSFPHQPLNNQCCQPRRAPQVRGQS